MTVQRGGGHPVVYVDGIRALDLDAAPSVLNSDHIRSQQPEDSRWSVDADGVLTFMAQDGNTVKRFRITPPADTSIDTLLKLPVIQ